MVNKGAFLFRQGDEAARVIILIKGRIKLVRTASDGRDLILCFIGPGHPFGLVASMLGRPQRISAQAVEPSTMLAWTTSAELLHRMLGLPQLVINLARIIAERLEATRDRLQDLSTERVEQRVARAVMRLGASLARPVGDAEAIELLVSQQDLAELADTTPYSISRILSHWKRLGVASVGRRRVLIQHPQTLDLYAQRIARPAQQTASVLPRAAGKGRVAETIAGSPSIVLCTRATTQPQFCGTK